MTTFNDKLRDSESRDFNQHSRAVDDQTAREIFLENLQEEIKTDPEERARLALLYSEDQGDQFYRWASERLLDEITPVFKGGWSHE